MRYVVDIPDDLLARARRAGCGDVAQYLLLLMRADLDGVTPEVAALLLQRFGSGEARDMTRMDLDLDANGRA